MFASVGNYEYIDEIKLIIKASVNNFFPMIFANNTSHHDRVVERVVMDRAARAAVDRAAVDRAAMDRAVVGRVVMWTE